MDGTRERLLTAAKTEFLERGYRSASLRRISSAAGVTTGAIYVEVKPSSSMRL